MNETTAGERLRDARKAAGLSAAELGRLAAQLIKRDRAISASAVRNQENGTNGIPMHVARAYAEILKVDDYWLLFGGATPAPPPEGSNARNDKAHDAEEGEGLTLRDLALISYGVVSGRWKPETIQSGAETDPDLFMYVPGFSDFSEESARLTAYQVDDGSLSPVFRKDEWLAISDPIDVDLRTGCYVLAQRLGGGDAAVEQAIKEVRGDHANVFLHDIANPHGRRIPIVRDGKPTGAAWIAGIVVGTMRLFQGGIGETMDVPVDSQLTMESEASEGYWERRAKAHAAALADEQQKKRPPAPE